MANASHPPGPWRIENGVLLSGIFNLEECPGPGHAADVNARLIAAAPEMLVALKRCEAMVSAADGPPNWDWVREVIAKAEGRS